MTPACAKHCPTESIKFGNYEDLLAIAEERVATLHQKGMTEAYLYGHNKESQPGTEGLNAFFLLADKPEVYNLPPDPVIPTKKVVHEGWTSFAYAALGMIGLALGSVIATRTGARV